MHVGGEAAHSKGLLHKNGREMRVNRGTIGATGSDRGGACAMGWETRGTGRYYYHKVRDGRKITSVYVGSDGDETACLVALVDEAERECDAEDRRIVRDWRSGHDAYDAWFRARCDLAAAIAAAAVAAAGYHRHARGRWRRRRMTTPMNLPAPSRDWDDDLRPLVGRALAGDEGADLRLRELLRADPLQFAGLAFTPDDGLAGDVADQVLDRMGLDPHGRAEIELAAARIRAGLEGPRPTAVEGLIIARILLSWLHLQDVERLIAGDPEAPPAIADWYDRRRDRAERGHLRALKALADVRRLKLPAVQVNIANAGGRQVNMGPNSG